MNNHAELVVRVTEAAKKYVVYGPRIMVLRDGSEEVSRGGIIIPDEAQRTKKVGTVVAIGAGYDAIAEKEFVEGVVIGHRVTFNAYDGVSHTIPVGDRKIEVLVMHCGNLYMGWSRNEEEEHAE